MKKVLYVIPAWQDTCRLKPYKALGKIAEGKGYTVIYKNVNWKKTLSAQLFPVEKEAIIFGFSLGAILGWLVAQDYSCKHLILASMTPHDSFTDPKIKKMLIEVTGNQFVSDINTHLKTKNKAKKQTVMYGDQEEQSGDILVPDTQHELTDNYIKALSYLL
ncbi:MAG: hypothetical protein NTV02_02515 [Candidatus Zambryskibacteria bacterium]|nr:hypothetical protein [Candidatus Zambryskibacteria bacterium]